MSEVDNFISAVKEKRDEACAAYEVALVAAFDDGGKPDWHSLAAKAIDQAIVGVLDLVEERYADLVTGTATDSEGEECSVELSITPDLSTLYFEEVSS